MVRTSRQRRLLVAVLFGAMMVAVVGVNAQFANADSQFGIRYVTNDCCQLRGTRAHIRSPNYNLSTSPAGYAALMRALPLSWASTRWTSYISTERVGKMAGFGRAQSLGSTAWAARAIPSIFDGFVPPGP